MSLSGSSASRKSIWAMTRLAISSSMSVGRKMIRALRSLEKMSNARSPRGVCSTGRGASRSHTRLVRYGSFQYRTASWDRPRRVIAKIEHHLGELFPRVGFIVTTLTGTNRAVVRFYNQRGTAEQWIKEGKEAAHSTRLSCHRFRANEVR